MRVGFHAHPVLLAVGAMLLALAVGAFDAVDPLDSRDVEAQVEPTVDAASQQPPPAPGAGDAVADDGSLVATDPSLIPATPVTPVTQSDDASVEMGEGMTTNLGGSDVAVASVGGSHEIDGPKRHTRRIPTPRPEP
jgi:hypothetical protein